MNILKIIFGTLVISLISINSFCQEKYLGTWKGELTQDPDSKYYFEINIEEIDKGGNFTGTTYEKVIPLGKSIGKSKDYVKLSCNGFIKNDIVYFYEQKILEQKKSSNYNWCIKSGELKLDTINSENILSGKWKGSVPNKEIQDICVCDFFNFNGSAYRISKNEFEITPNQKTQAGSVFTNKKLDFTKDFEIKFEVNLGFLDLNGADGVAMVFQNDPKGIYATGTNGEDIGAGGIKNSLILEIDTYYNSDKDFTNKDHTSIWTNKNGYVKISKDISFPNLEDGNWHTVKIIWKKIDLESGTLEFIVDGKFAGKIEDNLIKKYFGGSSSVFYGFTGSTGALTNTQKIRFSRSELYNLKDIGLGNSLNYNQNTIICDPGRIIVKKEPIKIAEIEKQILKINNNDEIDENNDYEKKFNRKVRIEKIFKVISNKVTIKVWDLNLEDGDRISLYLNGENILKDYQLLNKKHKIKASLKEGVNLFILHAENLGRTPPNTAAVSIKDGNKSHNLILKSNMNKSAALEIIRYVN